MVGSFSEIFVLDFGFNFHISFLKPKSKTKIKTKSKIQYKHFQWWATDYFHPWKSSNKSSKNIYQKRPSKKIGTPDRRDGVFGRKPYIFQWIIEYYFHTQITPKNTGPRPSCKGGASPPPGGGGR